jgi:cysteine desulfurase
LTVRRIYLDHNATTPLRPEARAAMLAAMDSAGNPSSVHAEGRAARAIVETARQQVAEAAGAMDAEVIFTSGSAEAAALALAGQGLHGAAIEHDVVAAWTDADLQVGAAGRVRVDDPQASTLQLANSETGIVQDLPQGLAASDITQGFGKVPFAYGWAGVARVMLSAHKIGGPKGVGALIVPRGHELVARIRGGGQESGRRSGTENVIGIAGFGAAAVAAQRDLAAGVWDSVAELRDRMEAALEDAEKDTIFVGKAAARLPNTACFVTPGWKGETQVMAMDLAGIAVSAGSACSSGKVRPSRVLRAMGFDEAAASSALRVSLGLDTTADEVMRFVQVWSDANRKRRARAA